MPGDNSQTMDVHICPKKLRKILPRPGESQVVLINQLNVNDSDAKESPNLHSLSSNNTPPLLVTNTVQNKVNVSSQILPKMLPFNNSFPPLTVINQQGMKINVVKAVWVPSSPAQPENRIIMTASNTHTPNADKSKAIKVTSSHDDSELCCRLCGKTFGNKDSLIDIFGSDGMSAKLEEKVHQCLPISVQQSDELPSTVCKECTSVLDLSFNLIITAVKTDQQLRNKLDQKKKNLESAKETDVKTPPKSSQPEVVTLDSTVDENSGMKPGHPNFDHTYISRGSSPDATDTDKSNEVTGTAGQSSDNGSMDTTECNICGKVFNDIEAFLRHVEVDHVSDAPITTMKRKATESNSDRVDEDDGLSEISLIHCFKCKEICLDEEDLQFHLNYECAMCDICGFKSRSRRNYVAHLKKNHEVTFEELQQRTDNCAKKTDSKKDGNSKSKGSVERIVNDSAGDDNVGIGSIGGDSLGRGFDSARENGGSGEEQECSICHRTFKNRLNFARHLKCHDPLGLERETKSFKCDICSRTYSRHDNFMKHKKLHFAGGTRSFACSFCNAKFDFLKDRLSHEKHEHSAEERGKEASEKSQNEKPKDNRLWVCSHCGKAMTSKLSLNDHERIHSGVKPCICEHCGRGFRTKTNLLQHMVVHTGEKKFSCPICGKEFSRKSFVREHVRSHTGEKPYVCETCGQKFTQSGDLNRHIRRQHNNLKEPSEIAAKKRKLSNEVTTDEVRDPVDTQLEDAPRTSSSSEFSDTSDLASDMYTVETITCEVCSEEFQDLDKLREHRFVVHGQEFQEEVRAEIVPEEEIVTEEILDEEMAEEGGGVKQYVLVVPS